MTNVTERVRLARLGKTVGVDYVSFEPITAFRALPNTRADDLGQKLSANAIQKIATLKEAKRKWDRVHSLVEQAATQAESREVFLRQCRRAAEDVSRVLEQAGFRSLADTADQLPSVIKRPGSINARLGGMREVVGALYTAIDRTESRIVRDERDRAAD